MEQRYYYKTQDEKGLMNLKHKLSEKEIRQHGLIKINKDEFDSLANREVEEENE